MPINVPHHSIIGNRGCDIGAASTDGVVPYWSSHLDSARSEVIVPADHSCHDHPIAIAELDRILQEHLYGIHHRTSTRSSNKRALTRHY